MYTDKDIILELKNICEKTRKREYLDKRNYLIGVLVNKYNYSDNRVSKFAGIQRTTVLHSRNIAKDMLSIQDTTFLHNIEDYIEKFPHDFESKTVGKKIIKVVTHISNSEYKRIKKYQTIKDLKTSTEAYRELLIKGLIAWEE
jgi:hypothetical protein